MTTTVLQELAELRTKTIGRFATVPVQLLDRTLDELTDHTSVSVAQIDAEIASMQRELTGTLFAIYRLLMLAEGRMVRNEVLRRAASRNLEPITTNSFQVHMHRLRKTLEVLQPDVELSTIRGYGYCLSKRK